MKQFNLTIKSFGVEQEVRCTQTDTYFVMAEERTERTIAAPIKGKLTRVYRADASPGSPIVTVKGRGAGNSQAYNLDQDPFRISVDWRLNGCRVINDALVDGLAMSDWTYFTRQKRALFSSVVNKLTHLGYSKKDALSWGRFATHVFTEVVKDTRGVNLNAAIHPDSLANDLAYEQRYRERMMNA